MGVELAVGQGAKRVEREQFRELQDLLSNFKPEEEVEDQWRWASKKLLSNSD